MFPANTTPGQEKLEPLKSWSSPQVPQPYITSTKMLSIIQQQEAQIIQVEQWVDFYHSGYQGCQSQRGITIVKYIIAVKSRNVTNKKETKQVRAVKLLPAWKVTITALTMECFNPH